LANWCFAPAGSAEPDNTMVGILAIDGSADWRRKNSKPSIRGIIMSSRITRGRGSSDRKSRAKSFTRRSRNMPSAQSRDHLQQKGTHMKPVSDLLRGDFSYSTLGSQYTDLISRCASVFDGELLLAVLGGHHQRAFVSRRFDESFERNSRRDSPKPETTPRIPDYAC
jgi:hypothetical protein